jgi:phosphatidylserine/phosphatidylglycerophosphate/cardiolipin synthase-like enzyme
VVGDDEAAVEGAYAASYQALQTAGIPLITATSSYIQHNKFVVLDEQTVWTGSANFTATDLTLNANNGIVLTSTRLAGTYTTEFEEMWSGQFHADKTDNTAHRWDYRGTLVESFFSPTDLVAFEVWRALADLDETLHVAMFFWTDELLTDRVVERLQAGAEVYGVWGALGAANPYSADETLRDAGAELRIEDFAGEIHHKFAIIDVYGSDPTVILGSYNWTESGAYANDENTLIIHSAPLAAAYYDEWQRLWNALAGTVYLPLVMRQTPSSPTPTPTLTPRLTDTPGPTATATPVPPSATPTFTPTPTETPEPVNIHITYIEYNPPGDDVQGEYVRIENQGEAPQTMTNWTLRDIANYVCTLVSAKHI